MVAGRKKMRKVKRGKFPGQMGMGRAAPPAELPLVG
jgi:hypothetical protein